MHPLPFQGGGEVHLILLNCELSSCKVVAANIKGRLRADNRVRGKGKVEGKELERSRAKWDVINEFFFLPQELAGGDTGEL